MAKKYKPGEYPVKLRIRKGDTVKVISGKDAGQTGVVLRAFPKVNKLLVEGINIIAKHQKARQTGRQTAAGVRQMQEGGIIRKPAPLAAPKVMLVCPNCQQPTRVGYAYREGEGKLARRKYRVCKRRECGKPID